MKNFSIGDIASDFTLPNELGQEINLYASLKNNSVILFFYPKDNTPGCIKESCFFRDNYEVLIKHSVTILGISADSVDSHLKFAQKHQLPYHLLSDKENKVRKMMKVASSVFGLLPGRVTFIIDQNKIIRKVISAQFSPAKHIEECLEYFENKLSE